MKKNIIAWRMTPNETVCRGFTDNPSVAENWRKAGCVVEPLTIAAGTEDDLDDDEFRACQLHWPEPYGSTIGRAADEIDRLRHDIERHIQIATDLCNDQPQTLPDSETLAYEFFKFLEWCGVVSWRDDFIREKWAELPDETTTGPCNVDCSCDHNFHGKNHYRELATYLLSRLEIEK